MPTVLAYAAITLVIYIYRGTPIGEVPLGAFICAGSALTFIIAAAYAEPPRDPYD